MLYGQTGKHKRPKNKSRELTEGFQQCVFKTAQLRAQMPLLPLSHSLAPVLHYPISPFSLARYLPPFLPSPPLCLILPLPPPETKCSKRKERTPFLLISWGLNRRRICCLSFSSAVHGLSTVLWSWACVAKSRRKEQGRHTQMPQWRSWTGLQWGLSSKWGPIISI